MPKVSEEHRAEKRRQIIAAMLRCVARDGFHRSTMAGVVKESGLSAGSVYTYFRGKNEIIRAMVESGLTGAREAIIAMASRGGMGDDFHSPDAVLLAATQHLVDLAEQFDVDLPRVALQIWAEAARDPEICEIVEPEARRVRGAWRYYAQAAIEAGQLRSDADPEKVAMVLTGLLPGFVMQRIVLGDVTPTAYAMGLAGLLD